jgi:hypothetical protein
MRNSSRCKPRIVGRESEERVITRLSSRPGHPATRAYAGRRTEEGLSKKEIIRCLKRYAAREVYHCLRDSV